MPADSCSLQLDVVTTFHTGHLSQQLFLSTQAESHSSHGNINEWKLIFISVDSFTPIILTALRGDAVSCQWSAVGGPAASLPER